MGPPYGRQERARRLATAASKRVLVLQRPANQAWALPVPTTPGRPGHTAVVAHGGKRHQTPSGPPARACGALCGRRRSRCTYLYDTEYTGCVGAKASHWMRQTKAWRAQLAYNGNVAISSGRPLGGRICCPEQPLSATEAVAITLSKAPVSRSAGFLAETVTKTRHKAPPCGRQSVARAAANESSAGGCDRRRPPP